MAGFPFGAGGIPFPFAAAAAAAGGDPRFFPGMGGGGMPDDDEDESLPNIDYYEVLGVSRDASEGEIRKAHKKLRVKSHPDRPGGDKEKFQAVERAGHVLGNSRLRQAFDRGGEKLVRRMEAMMGDDHHGGSGRPQSNVPPVRMRVGVGLSKLVGEFTVDVPVERKIIVPVSEVDSPPRGSQMAMMRLPPTNAPTRVYVKEEREQVEVTIPAGCPDGRRVTVYGKGHEISGEKGDVEIQISVKPERGFESDGPNLITRLKVPLASALLGGPVSVRHLDGRRLEVVLPPGKSVKDDEKIMIRNQGLPIAGLSGGARGLLVGVVKVVWPKSINLEGVDEDTIAAVRAVLSGEKPGKSTGKATSVPVNDDSDDEWGPETTTTRAAGDAEPVSVDAVPFDEEEFRAAINAARDPDADEDGRGPGGQTVVECAIA